MKYYLRFLSAAAVCGVLCIWSMTRYMETAEAGEIVRLLGMWHMDFYPGYVPDIMFWYAPLLFFHIFYGSYIYRHFCTASVYYFSRSSRRIPWFLREAGVLYLFSLSYVLLLLIAGMITACLTVPTHFDRASLLLGGYYLLIYSLFNFAVTLTINLVSIVLGSNLGFALSEGCVAFFMSCHVLVGKLFVTGETFEEWLEQLLPYLSDNFDFVVDYCKKHIPQIKTYAPDATYLMWLDCRDLHMTNEELRDFFIHKAKLGLNEGYTFGRSLSGYMRLNVACPRATLEKALTQLRAAVDALA